MVPEYDKERYMSRYEKIIQWYNLLTR
ncbi:MAG: hypothetical protein ACLU30_03940 [Odoribacter splanchnicus]